MCPSTDVPSKEFGTKAIYRKLAIGVLLCGGIFVMVATLLRCILSLKDASGINNSTIWAIRETVGSVLGGKKEELFLHTAGEILTRPIFTSSSD